MMKSAVLSILGKSSSIGMKLLEILDNIDVHSVISDAPVLRDSPKTLGDPILQQYYDVFNGLNELPGECTIQIKPDSVPVVNPPHRLPVSLRSVVKAKLDTLVNKQIIA